MYCSLADIQAQLRDEVLISLTDDAGAGTIDPAKVDEAIVNAGNEVDGYVQMRYPLPLPSVPPILKTLTISIAIYNLFSRRGFDESSADRIVADRYKNAIRFLEKLASGSVQLPTDSAKPDALTDLSSNTRIFSRERMRGY